MNYKGIKEYCKNTKAFRDLVMIYAVAVLIFVLATVLDALETISEWSQEYGEWRFDVFLTLLVFLAFSFGIFSLRRWRELRREVAERNRAEDAFRESEMRFRTIIEKNADPIVIVDKRGIVLFVNPAAEVLFGRKAEEILGESFGYPVVAGQTTEIDVLRNGGRKAVAEMRVVEMNWKGENVHLASLRDISDHKCILAELEQTRQQQLQMKDQFLSKVSHELRSPLSVIHQFTTIMIDGIAGDLSQQQREYLEIVLGNVDQLRTMIDDLLAVTRADTSGLTVEPHSVSVADLLDETMSMNRAIADAKDITLSADFPDNLPPAYADPRRIRQVLINLIDNGIKFTPANGTITVRAQVFDEDPNFLCVSVADTGCGIDPEEGEKIFEYLYQSNDTIEICRKGLGIGLYICKELVSRHNGRIWVESQVGRGSTFFFTLPIFSLVDGLVRILTPKNLRNGSVALVTVEVFPTEKRPLTKTDETVLEEVWELLNRCILPDVEVLLPRMAHLELGEVSFAVVCANQSTATSLLRRIQGHLARCDDLHNDGLDTAVSFTMVDFPSATDDKPVEEVVEDIAASIEDRLTNTFEKRRHFYGQRKNSHRG